MTTFEHEDTVIPAGQFAPIASVTPTLEGVQEWHARAHVFSEGDDSHERVIDCTAHTFKDGPMLRVQVSATTDDEHPGARLWLTAIAERLYLVGASTGATPLRFRLLEFRFWQAAPDVEDEHRETLLH